MILGGADRYMFGTTQVVLLNGGGVGYVFVNQHANTTKSDVPSYFRNGMCGFGDNPRYGVSR